MPSPLTVIVSGCSSGPNPSPGLGVARSLRAAFPSAHMIARDASPASTGLHSELFNETWICSSREPLDDSAAREQLLERLSDAWLVSGLDLEVRRLASLDHPRILAPSSSTIRIVAKPSIRAGAGLPVRIPDWLPLTAGEQAVQSFCRRHDWCVWVKGPAYESRTAGSWQKLLGQADALGRTWGRDGLFVQTNVSGEEVSVAFAAYRGELLNAVLLEKHALTEQGKVWAGAIESVPVFLLQPLRLLLQELGWTGGGELEFVRDRAGELWLFDWNPRFPAWIHGATLAGHNLPGVLLEAATGVESRVARRSAGRFVRQVIEVPAREGLALPRERLDPARQATAKQWAKALPVFARQGASRTGTGPISHVSVLPAELALDLRDAASQLECTPARVLLRRTAEARLGALVRLVQRCGIRAAYSIKTNPDSTLLALAHRHGLMAEAIGEQEIAWAMECGWPAGEILVNGPVPVRKEVGATAPLAAAFADDTEGLELYLREPGARVIGIRLRPPFFASRFGVSLESPAHVRRLVELFQNAPHGQRLGLSFHAASSELGLGRWERLARSVIDWAGKLCELSGRQVSLLDLGGGWTPDDLDVVVEGMLVRLVTHARSKLGRGVSILIEPGKALVQPVQAVIAKVAHIRRGRGDAREAILDAGIGDVPQLAAHPHRLAVIRGGEVAALESGPDRLLGPLCMESDRIADAVALPVDLAVGDLVAICDAGAYDASMAFALGRGGATEGHLEPKLQR